MKNNGLRTLALVLGIVTTTVHAADRGASWQEVRNAIAQGRPQTAIEHLEPIIRDALADQAYPEAVRALAQKFVLEGNIQGNKPEEKIVRLQAELANAAAPMRPVMEALLAHWYWHYYQQNRWRFMERTQLGEAAGPDLQTWDLERILAEIDTHFTAALADEATLQATPIGDYAALIESGSVPPAYRPTLFDFLAHEALQFYQAGEQGAVRVEDEFIIDAGATPIFAEMPEFLQWEPQTSDAASPLLKAVRLYQKLLRFHAGDADRTALFDANLARLQFGKNGAVGEEKDARYAAALERLIAATADHEISARALVALAELRHGQEELVQARELAARAMERFPESAGAAMGYNLIQAIEAKSAQVMTERVWNEPWPTLDVSYRNVTQVHFRAIAIDFETYLRTSRWSYGSVDHSQRDRLLSARAAHAWSAELPPTTDYRERTEALPAPSSLRPGFYYILASYEPDFRDQENQLSIVPVWVSDLALVLQLRNDEQQHSGLVLRARTGEPVDDARVEFWRRDREGWLRQQSTVTTDSLGRFELPADEREIVVVARQGEHAISSIHAVSYYRHETETAGTRTVFFTDRALYRPGQSVHYKGVCVDFDHPSARYATAARKRLTVVFSDPNGKEIARSEHVTNDYGSFHGVFTAPRDRLMGQMMIRVEDNSGLTHVTVEEYKRPKFLVELAPPSASPRLDQPVELTGTATAYTGAAIDGATVSWRVERSVQLPLWCWWWQPPATQAIAHGTATTAVDGTFPITFPATPDRSVPESTEPVFSYTIHADVTDSAGETRSTSRVVRAGYTALQASLDVDDWQTTERAVEVTIATRSLDGDPQPAQGTLTIHALQQPEKVARAPLQQQGFWWQRYGDEPPVDPHNPDSWPTAELVWEESVDVDAKGTAEKSARLPVGIYRATLATTDRFGREVTARKTIQVVDPTAPRHPVKMPNVFTAPAWSVEPGETFTFLWGTGYDTGRAFVELESGGRILRRFWTDPGRTQTTISQEIAENMRGGLTVRVTYLRENRVYLNTRIVDVPWSNKRLDIAWDTFRSKLKPGETETWTATVKGPDAQGAVVEMVAALYDAALDQFLPHAWPQTFPFFRREIDRLTPMFQNAQLHFQHLAGYWERSSRAVDWTYAHFPYDLIQNLAGYQYLAMAAAPGEYRRRGGADEETVVLSAFEVTSDKASGYAAAATLAGNRMETDLADAVASPQITAETPPQVDLSQVTARRNLNETAFFLPQVVSAPDGTIKLQFTMPEALTEWKFLGFAHDGQLRSGALTDTVVTSKDVMVQPNPPRFVREGDAIEFSVKVTNRSETAQRGTVQLTFADAATLTPRDDVLGNARTEQPFDVPAGESRSYAWRITIPDGVGFLTYKAVGASLTASDGEEGFLPVLSRRVLVRESLPLPIRGATTRNFEFTKLLESARSQSLQHQSLTVQMVSQPAWYAVMALPYLMEFPYECSEQVFNRLYANALARHIAGSDPKIRRIFDLWKDTPALDSPLEQNEDLKSVLLEETPWVRQAAQESQSRRNVGLLFDANRLDREAEATLQKLADRQLSEGLWAWFPGGPPNEYISLYIATGFGRLRHLGASVDVAPAVRALTALDAWMHERYGEIRDRSEYVPSYLDAFYLYGRSFFLRDQAVAPEHQEAVEFFQRQSRKFWLRVDSRQSQAHLAIALRRFGDHDTPAAIMQSIRERSVRDDELGMFWRDLELSWWWFRAPIETQAMMIEAFAEVENDAEAVEACKVWLLKQKQTQDWKTTKATADAIYALLLRGENLLASDALVEVSLGGETIRPQNVEAGTGFYQETFVRGEVEPDMGTIRVRKTDAGVSWGSVHWQYLEDVAKLTPHEATPLRLKKTLFRKVTTERGQVLQPVQGPLAVGDELVVRIELRTDRDMEYVHLKDQRGSGTEPVNVLSGQRYQDGLRYYESTRDTASHFFIEYLPKGVYVFEYSTRVQLRGTFQSGFAEIQCMYAPEFSSHSESFALEVR